MHDSNDAGSSSQIPNESPPSLEDMAKVEEEWAKFVAGRTANSQLRDTIKESWLRSRDSGVDPQSAAFQKVSQTELDERLAQNSELVDIARTHLEWVSVCLGGTEHAIYLTDADGIVLFSTGNNDELIEEFNLTPGYDWSEATMGTNGAGTALAAKTPVAVVGPEHYRRNMHRGICTAAPIRDADGQIIAAVDISVGMIAGTPARLALAIQAASTIEEKFARRVTYDRLMSTRRFLANVSHEVRTPMSVIQGYVHVLRDSATEPGQFQALDAIERNSAHLLNLLDDILDLSRVASGELEVVCEPFELASLIFDVVALMEIRAEEAGVDLPSSRAARCRW